MRLRLIHTALMPDGTCVAALYVGGVTEADKALCGDLAAEGKLGLGIVPGEPERDFALLCGKGPGERLSIAFDSLESYGRHVGRLAVRIAELNDVVQERAREQQQQHGAGAP